MNKYSKHSIQLVFIGILLFLQGCTAIYINKPIGIKPHPISADYYGGQWRVDGWSSKPFVIDVHVIDGAKGIFKVANVNFDKKKNEVELNQLTCQLMESGEENARFGYINCYSNRYKKSIFFTRIRFHTVATENRERESELNHFMKEAHMTKVIWPLNVEEFEKAVKANEIEGVVKKGQWNSLEKRADAEDDYGTTIFLLDDPVKIMKLIEQDTDKYYAWDYPVIFTKIVWP